MATYKIDFRTMLVRYFGLENLNLYRVTGKDLEDGKADYIIDLNVDDVNELNVLGLPVFSSLELGEVVFQGNKYGPFKFQDILMDISQESNIVTTVVQGRKGTIKEQISLGDVAVSLRGLIVNENGTETSSLAAAFKRYMDLPVAFPVTNPILNKIGVYYLVRRNLQFPGVNQQMNVQAFSIEMLSDDAIELIISE